MTHKGIIAIIFVAGIIGMGVYSLNNLIEQGKETKEPQQEHQQELTNESNISDDVNATLGKYLGNGTNYHVIIDDGVRGTAT